MKKIIIIGAGISGLSLAWYLQKKDPSLEIQILEKTDRPGGWLYTKHLGEFLFEQGPRTFRASGSGALLELVKDLGLEVIYSAKEALHRYIYYKGKLEALPSNLFSFLFSPLTRDLLPAFLSEPFKPRGEKEDETIYEFISRRLNCNAAERLFDPMTLGIYAGDIRKLSLKSCFPLLHEWEKTKGSLIKGMLTKQKAPSGLFSFQKGTSSLIQALVKNLQVEFHFNSEVVSLCPQGKKVEVVSSQGKYLADQAFLATPCSTAAKLLPSCSFLREMRSNSLTVVCLGYHQKVLQKQGFGYLIPSFAGEPVLGAVWDSHVFPQQNRQTEETRITVMLKEATEVKSLALAKDALWRHLGIERTPDASVAFLAKNAIPQFEVGHANKLAAFEKQLSQTFPQVGVVGNYLESISVSGCLDRSKKIAEDFLRN